MCHPFWPNVHYVADLIKAHGIATLVTILSARMRHAPCQHSNAAQGLLKQQLEATTTASAPQTQDSLLCSLSPLHLHCPLATCPIVIGW